MHPPSHITRRPSVSDLLEGVGELSHTMTGEAYDTPFRATAPSLGKNNFPKGAWRTQARVVLPFAVLAGLPTTSALGD